MKIKIAYNTGFASGGETSTSRGRLCKLGVMCPAMRDSVLVDSLAFQPPKRKAQKGSSNFINIEKKN